jgi:hypothetical protein
MELRRRFPGRAIAVINLVNGQTGYLPPADAFPRGSYQVETSPFSPGCLEETIRVCVELVERLQQMPCGEEGAA